MAISISASKERKRKRIRKSFLWEDLNLSANLTHWALALIKGIREPHEVKTTSFDLSGNRTHDLPEKVGNDFGGESRRRERKGTLMNVVPRSKDFFLTSCGSLIPFTRANAQWVIHGLN